MILLQVLSVLFGLFMIYWVRLHFKKQHFELLEYSLWITIWLVFIYLAIFPQTFQGITEVLRISRVFDLLVIIALMIIVFLTLQNRIFFRRLEKKLEMIVRKKAIDEQATSKD